MRDTILIVEDDEMICQGIVDALQLRNWKTDVASDLRRGREEDKRVYVYVVYSGYEAARMATGFLFAGKSEPLRKSGFVPISV